MPGFLRTFQATVALFAAAGTLNAQSGPDQWSASVPSPLPFTIGEGGAIVAVDADSLYVALGGGSSTFGRYTISTGAWVPRASTGLAIAQSTPCSMTFASGTSWIYLMRHNLSNNPVDFQRYNLGTDT